MKAVLNHFAFEFKTGLRNPTQLLMNYLFPLGFYVMMGAVMVPINPLFAASMVPAMIAVAAMASALLGLPGTLVESREAGIYRSFKINGVPAASILAVPALSTLFPVLIVAAVITVTAPLFKGELPVHWAWFVLVTVITAFSYAALGALIGVVATDSRSTVLYSQLIFLPSMILGGFMVPTEILPAAIQPLARLLPATYTMQAYKGLAYDQTTVMNPALALAVLLSSGILALGLGIYLFNWDSRNLSRRGHPAMGLLVLAPYLLGALLS
jgi:ABC-2 type transport system permease protein